MSLAHESLILGNTPVTLCIPFNTELKVTSVSTLLVSYRRVDPKLKQQGFDVHALCTYLLSVS